MLSDEFTFIGQTNTTCVNFNFNFNNNVGQFFNNTRDKWDRGNNLSQRKKKNKRNSEYIIEVALNEMDVGL
jgi:hypothetical protein